VVYQEKSNPDLDLLTSWMMHMQLCT
jgi:hypothetical protein